MAAIQKNCRAIHVLPVYGPEITPEAEAAAERRRMDTPFWKTVAAMRRKRDENPRYIGKEAWNNFIADQKSKWHCVVCLKRGDHISLDCPYLKYLPEGASVGPAAEIVCAGCAFRNEHDITNCIKRAIITPKP